MNVYDFDRTLYPGDASLDFWRWCLRRHPRTLCHLPAQTFAFGLWCVGLWGRTRLKAAFFAFLRAVPDPEAVVRSFWDASRMPAPWYPPLRRDTDIIISASPAFLLRACPWLPEGSVIIATEMDVRTGRIQGRNCRGAEKVRRFRECFPEASIERFCSDSLSDAPLAALAARPCLVRGGGLVPWDTPDKTWRRVVAPFLSVRFLRFLLCGGVNVATGVGFAWALSLALQANVAFVVGYVLSHALSYLLNAWLTFRRRPTCVGYLRYAVAYLPNFAIQNAMVALLHNLLGMPKSLTFLASALLGIPITFLALTFYAFARRHGKSTGGGDFSHTP